MFRLDEFEARLEELNRQLMDPAIASQRDRYKLVNREHAEVSRMVDSAREIEKLEQERADLKEMLADPELRSEAESEKERIDARIPELELGLRLMMLPTDPYEGRNILLEVRAGTGGDEAALFAADLFRMYSRYASEQGWKLDVLSFSDIFVGTASGFKEIIASVTGETAYRFLKYESGATVAILPEPDEIEIKIADKDLRIDVFRAGGPGGQSVNTTDSAVRIVHIPSGLVVICQDEKSQTKNKAKAMKVLCARLLEKERSERDAAEAADRKSQVGSGDRSERIRTYNYAQNRVTDHRVTGSDGSTFTLYKLDKIIEGDLDELLGGVLGYFQAEALRQAEGR